MKVPPLGTTPVLLVGAHAIFESAVIPEYLEETQPRSLHPAHPLHRAEHRAFIEHGPTVLSDIAGLYSAPDETAFKARVAQLEARFARLETRVAGPWFEVLGPVFRYFEVFDAIGDFGIPAGKPKKSRVCRA